MMSKICKRCALVEFGGCDLPTGCHGVDDRLSEMKEAYGGTRGPGC